MTLEEVYLRRDIRRAKARIKELETQVFDAMDTVILPMAGSEQLVFVPLEYDIQTANELITSAIDEFLNTSMGSYGHYDTGLNTWH